MAYSDFSYTADGTKTTWALPFDFVATESVKVYLGGTLKTLNTDYTLDVTNKTVTFTTAPTSGVIVRIRRVSSVTASYTNFSVGVISPTDLNDSEIQNLQIAQELDDRMSSLEYQTYSGALLVNNNLSDLNDVPSARTHLGLGTASVLNVGAAANNIVQLTSDDKLPAVDGSNLTGLLKPENNLSDLSSASTARTNLGLGTASVLNVGTAANNIVQLDSSGKIPALDGSQITGIIEHDSSALKMSNNLSDLTSVTTARTNLSITDSDNYIVSPNRSYAFMTLVSESDFALTGASSYNLYYNNIIYSNGRNVNWSLDETNYHFTMLKAGLYRIRQNVTFTGAITTMSQVIVINGSEDYPTYTQLSQQDGISTSVIDLIYNFSAGDIWYISFTSFSSCLLNKSRGHANSILFYQL